MWTHTTMTRRRVYDWLALVCVPRPFVRAIGSQNRVESCDRSQLVMTNFGRKQASCPLFQTRIKVVFGSDNCWEGVLCFGRRNTRNWCVHTWYDLSTSNPVGLHQMTTSQSPPPPTSLFCPVVQVQGVPHLSISSQIPLMRQDTQIHVAFMDVQSAACSDVSLGLSLYVSHIRVNRKADVLHYILLFLSFSSSSAGLCVWWYKKGWQKKGVGVETRRRRWKCRDYRRGEGKSSDEFLVLSLASSVAAFVEGLLLRAPISSMW